MRKHFRKVVWSVGIVEKVILRWRRKGSGLRGFRSNALTKISDIQIPSKDDGGDEDYDFLREGRKQTEQRMNRALSRVKSMVQYPEARDQYRRLLTGVEELKVSKVSFYFTDSILFHQIICGVSTRIIYCGFWSLVSHMFYLLLPPSSFVYWGWV